MSAPPTLVSPAPDHVPPHLVWNHALEDFTHELDDPFLAASRLHDGSDVFWATDSGHGRPAWVITRHALIHEAFSDYEHFTSAGGSGMEAMLGVSWRLIPLDFDPPQQALYRHALNPYFTPRRVGELETRVREVCNSLIDKFADKGSCEFIADFAVPFPSYIFLAVVGLPLDLAPQFLAWENALMRVETPGERVAAAKAVAAYLEDFVKRQRRAPDTDLLRGLDAAEIEGRRLTDEEILGMLYTMYLGGLDTVYSTLGWMLRHLAIDQALQSRLRAEPSLIPAAVDELARAYSVVSTRRRVAKDFDFHGVRMRAGDLVVLPLYLAGRDPQTHGHPHDIVLDRHSGRLTFATGPHHCLGAHLARREMKVALETLLGRFEHIRIPEGERYAYHTGVVFGVDRLPLTWDAAG